MGKMDIILYIIERRASQTARVIIASTSIHPYIIIIKNKKGVYSHYRSVCLAQSQCVRHSCFILVEVVVAVLFAKNNK